MVQERIAAAGNTDVPAYLTLTKLGYLVERTNSDGQEHWAAKKGTLELVRKWPFRTARPLSLDKRAWPMLASGR